MAIPGRPRSAAHLLQSKERASNTDIKRFISNMAQRRNQRGAAADAVAPEEVFHDAAPPPAPAPAAAAPAEPQAAAQQELIGRDAMGRVDRFSGSSGED